MRKEDKYLVSLNHRSRLLSDIEKFTRKDVNSEEGRTGYKVSSIYFDNPLLKSYFDKIDGNAKKFKLRIRNYPSKDSSKYNLEIKHKFFAKSMKDKTAIDRSIYYGMIINRRAPHMETMKDAVLENFVAISKLQNFSPLIRVAYDRVAFFSKYDKDIRITLDFNIKCSRLKKDNNSEPNMYVLPKEFAVLEIKTNKEYPFWLSLILKKYFLKKIAISKYALAIESMASNSFIFVK